MAHASAMSMRAFTKGRCAFDSDEEYRAALRGELLDDLDVHEDFGYESGSPEDPDDGEGPDAGGPREDEGDRGDLADEEAVKAELEGLEERIGGTHFLEVLEKFMKDCSGREEPPYLPFPMIRDREVAAVFRDGSGGLRLRYGAYGFEADRLEGDEVVQTWRGLSTVEALNDWDDSLLEPAEEAEETEEDAKDEFFDDLPDVLADRKRCAAFLGFVADASPAFADEEDGTAPSEVCLPFSERFWLAWNGAECEFRLKRPVENGALATWDKEEFLEKLREVAWDDADARESMLGGGLEKAWDALDSAWYDEEDDGSVEKAVGKFLDRVKSCRGNGSVREDVDVVGGSGYGEAGREDMTLVWSGAAPDMAQLTVRTWLATDDKDEDTYDVPLAFLRWWKFGRGERGW